MHLIKEKKIYKYLIAFALCFTLGVVSNVYSIPHISSVNIVYADDVKVYSGEIMRTGGDTVYSGDATSPNAPRTVSGMTNMVYLSDDGKTRYLEVKGTSAGWYVWNPDKNSEYGGNWVRTDKNIIPQTGNAGDRASTFEKENGYAFNASPIELKDKFGKDSNTSTGAPTAPEKAITPDEAEAKSKAVGEYNKYLKLGDEPTSATLLASVILQGGNTTGIDRKTISYSELSKFPSVENVDTKLGDKEVSVDVYEYGNIKKGVASTTTGATTANVIKVLTRYGWLSTNNKSENNTNWYQQLKDNISNPVYAVGTIIATIGGVIGDFLVSVCDSLITGLGTVVGWLLPIKIFGFAGEGLTSIAQVDNWFTRVAKKVIEILFGKDSGDLLKRLVWLSAGLGFVFTLFNFMVIGKKDGIKSAIITFKKPVYQLLIWSLGLVSFAMLYPTLNQSDTVDGAPARDKLQSETTFNSQYYMIASNGDPSVLYPDTYQNLNTNKLLTNSQLDESFKPSGKTVSEANQRVKDILGSELIAQIESKKEKDDGVLSGVVNNSTWNVNDYLSGIETAGQPLTTSDGGFALNTGITANRLPSGLSWNNNISSITTVSVTPTQLSGENVQDVLKQGWFMFKGTPVWFDAITDDTTAKSEESSYVSSGGWVGIKYSPSIYNPQKVSQTDAHTYLYGAIANNNAMTLNVSNYTFMSGITLNSDLLSYPKGNNPIEKGEEIKRSNKPNNGEISKEISSKLAKTKDTITSDNLQWRNAYMIAMYNKYAGTNQTTQAGYASAGNMGFSNQSTMILLQSTYSKNGLSYYGYNTPNSKSDNSKAQTQDNVYLSTFSTIGSGNALSNALSRTSYGLIANAIIMVGITICIFQFGMGIIVKDAWTYFGRWLFKASATGLLMTWIVVIYYILIFNISKVISNTVLKIVSLTVTELQTDGSLATTNTFVIGFILIGLALLTTMRLIKLNGRKVSFSSLFFYAITIAYDSTKEFLEKLDMALYETSGQKTSTTPSDIDDNVYKGFNRGGGFFKSAMGSFVGNAFADKVDGKGNGGSMLPIVGDDNGADSPIGDTVGGKSYNLPISGVTTDEKPISSGLGKIGSLGKSAVKGGLSKKLLTHGAVGALGFTPLGFAGTSYMAMRGAVKASKGIKNTYGKLKGSEFGSRLGLNGRSEQLKSHYGLKSDDELATHISAGKIKPRKGEQSHFDSYVANNNWVNKLNKQGSLTPETKQRLQRVNSIGFKAPNINQMKDKLKQENQRKRYVENDNIKVNPATKAIVMAKAFADGKLMEHTKSTIPQRRKAYLEEQFKQKK